MRTVSIFLGMLLLFAPLHAAKSKAAAAPVDPDYVSALATANDFLHAWQTQDGETAIMLLTDRLKQRTPENVLGSFFSPSVSQRQGFEIGRGKRLAAGRYQFPVSLFQKPAKTTLAKTALERPRSQPSALIVVKTGEKDWAVDKLP